MNELFADGGVMVRNPSPIGGTWAWRRVDEAGEIVAASSGVVRPEELGAETVSNTNTELLALLEGIEALPDGWTGRISSDSGIALGWLFRNWTVAWVPTPLRNRMLPAMEILRSRRIAFRLLGGHPTKADLERGIRARLPQLPVSAHNVWADQECQRLARLHGGPR